MNKKGMAYKENEPGFIKIYADVKEKSEKINADGFALFTESEEKLYPIFWHMENDLAYKSNGVNEGILGQKYSEKANSKLDKLGKDEYLNQIISEKCSVIFARVIKNGICIYFRESVKFTDEELTKATGDLKYVGETLNLDPNPNDVVVKLTDVKRDYITGDYVTNALKGINLSVKKGEFVALLGESGCGKTTLLNAVGGMDQKAKGSVLFEGREILGASEKKLTLYRRNNIGFIFQTYNLMPNLNVKQNIDLISELVKKPLPTDDVLKTVGLLEKKRNYPSELSGGQQQRVSIARALVKNPTLMMADEPTAALDYATSIEVLEALDEVVKRGTTLFMVTHNEEIAKMADRVVRMKNGRLVEVYFNLEKVPAKDLVW